MTYPEAIAYLLSLLGDIRSSHFGLERMERLTARLGDPQRRYRVVHVAGTNGKGSTAAMIESGLRAAGYSTGLYTSPHLVRFNERIRINGEEISDAGFAAAVEEVRAANEHLVARYGRYKHPTLFESVTAAAFCAFRNASVEWAVVEVGLGGRLDATNVVQPELAVVTPIDLDHESFLGKGPQFIAGEKAGILKPSIKAVVAGQPPQAARVLHERAKEMGIRLVYVPEAWTAEGTDHIAGYYRFRAVQLLNGTPSGKSVAVQLPLAGEHQVQNALAAIAALDLLGVDATAMSKGLQGVRWPGRLEQIEGRPEILLDAAHNPAGARVLARYLEKHQRGRRVYLIYGASRDKAVDEMAGLLFPLAERVILTRSQVARAVSPEVLRTILDHHHDKIDVAASAEEALRTARRGAQGDDLILVAGSIFLVGEARELLKPVP